MADYSLWQTLLPALAAGVLFTVYGNQKQAAFEKEIRRILAEKFPGVDVVTTTVKTISLRFEGRVYDLASPALYKTFSRKKKAQLPEQLQADLLAKTGVPLDQLSKPRPAAAPIGELTFDKADLGGGTLTAAPCEACQKPLSMEYFDINGKPHCRECKDQVVEHLISGSNWRFVPRALLYGTGAAFAGCMLYYGIRAATGYEVGLIAIVVGLMVGGAVRKASHSRGGPLFQTIAIALTYTAIVFNYSPDLIKAMRDKRAPEASAAQTKAPAVPPAATSAFGMAVMIAVLYAIPFLGGARNLMGLFIIGFALYEAWRLNKRPPLNIAGPLQLRRS